MKAVGIALAVLVVIGAGVVWWVTTELDRTIAQKIEEVGTDLLDSRVEVAGVETDLREGRASIYGLTVANPRGEDLAFSSNPAFTLGEITVAIDIASLGDGPIPITVVRVLAPELNAEVTKQGINLNELKKRLDSSGGDDSDADDEAASGEPTRLRIDSFEFAEGIIRANAEAIGADAYEVKLPAVRLANLEGTPDEIGEQVLDVYLGKASKAVGKGRLEAEIDKQTTKAKKKAKKKLKEAAGSLLGGEK